MFKHFKDLADQAVRGPKPDLVVWPETSYPITWFDVTEGVAPKDLERDDQKRYNLARLIIREDMRDWQVPTLFGVNALERAKEEKPWKYNSALLVDAQGKAVDRYDKMHLVPFGGTSVRRDTAVHADVHPVHSTLVQAGTGGRGSR